MIKSKEQIDEIQFLTKYDFTGIFISLYVNLSNEHFFLLKLFSVSLACLCFMTNQHL